MWEWINNFAGALLNILTSILFVKISTDNNIKINRLGLILSILISTLALQYSYILEIPLLKFSLVFLIFSLLFVFVFKLNIGKAIILIFIFYSLGIFGDIVSVKAICFVFGEKVFYEKIAGGLFGTVIPMLLIILVTLVLKKIIKKFINVKIKYRLVVISVFSLFCVTAIYYVTYKYGTTSLDNLLGFIYIIVVTMILVSNFVQEYKNNKLTLEYDNLLEFIKKYEVEIDNQRILRHENKNQLLTIKSKIIDKDKNEEIIKYIDEVLNDRRNVKQIEYAKFSNLPSNGIKGLFYFKVATAQEKNIRVEVNISKEINKSFLSKLDSVTFNQLGKILGVYLDNAIEGAETSNDKVMGIEIFLKGRDVIFIISNSYNSKIKKRGRTTKGVGHGYGLLLVNSILSGNKRFESTTEIINNLYVKKLIVKE